MNDPLKITWQPQLKSPALVVAWSADASQLSTNVSNYLVGKLGGRSFAELEPLEFFPLNGVTIEDDLVQFPESRFYACPEKDLVLFESAPPTYEWHRFLSLVLDFAQNHCHIRELYTMGAMVSLGAHTTPRQILGTFSSAEMKNSLSQYHLSGEWDYETPPTQRPTLNSFLLWAAKKRNIPAVSLWVPVPFYLMAVDDPQGRKMLIDFFNQRLVLGFDLRDLDEEIGRQNTKLAEMRTAAPDINESIGKLEANVMLSDEENQKLIKEVRKVLSGEN